MRHLLLASLLLAAACGDVTRFTDAAPGDDDGIDGDTVDGPGAGPLTVTTLSRYSSTIAAGTPVAGVRAIATAPDGTIRDSDETGGDGTTTLDVVTGDSVTVVYPPGEFGSIDLATVVAVAPGDSLVFGEEYDLSSGTSVETGQMTITWPADPSVTSWSGYWRCGYFYPPAGGPPTATTLIQYDYCQSDTIDIVLRGYDANGLVRWAFADDVPFQAGGTYAFASTLGAGVMTFTLSGLPPEVTDADIGASLYLDDGSYAYGTGIYGMPADGTVTGTEPWPAATGAVGQGNWGIYRPGLYNQGGRGTFAGNVTSYAVTVDPLPWIDNEGVQVNAAAGQFRWIQTEGAAYDAAVVELDWSLQQPNLHGKGGDYYRWRWLLPPGVDSVDIPLPAELAAYLPADADPYGRVALFEVEAWDGYDAARAAPERVWGRLGYGGSTDVGAVHWSGSSGAK